MNSTRANTDYELIRATLSGDKSAFGELVIQYQRKVYRFVYRIIRNPFDASDIVQETFIKAYQKLSELKNWNKFPSWLLQIAKNHCIDWIRQRQRELSLIEDELENNRLYLPPAPDEILIELELHDQVMQAISELPEHNRKAVEMFYLEGKTYAEIQHELGITKGTLGRWLYQARLELRKLSQKAYQIGIFCIEGAIRRSHGLIRHPAGILGNTTAVSVSKCLIASVLLHAVFFSQINMMGLNWLTSGLGNGNLVNNAIIDVSIIESKEPNPVMTILRDSSNLPVRTHMQKPDLSGVRDRSTMATKPSLNRLLKVNNAEIKFISDHLAKLPSIRPTVSAPLVKSPTSLPNNGLDLTPVNDDLGMKYNPIRDLLSKSSFSGGELIISRNAVEMINLFYLLVPPSTQKDIEYVLLKSFPEKAYPKFDPRDIAVDKSGNIIVTDSINRCIYKLDGNGTILTKWGEKGYRKGQFRFPCDLAIDASGKIYVTDPHNYRVQKFDERGNFLLQWGKHGRGMYGEFKSPSGIAIDKKGFVYVADAGANCIQKFTSNGDFITKWGGKGYGEGKFRIPGDVAVDDFGNVYVADNDNYRIQKFDSNGNFLTKWGLKGSEDGKFGRLGGIAVDKAGNVYVVDVLNHRIQKFNSEGFLLAKWGKPGTLPDTHWEVKREAEDDEFVLPSSIAVDEEGNVYVTDVGYIKIFQPIKKAEGSDQPNEIESKE